KTAAVVLLAVIGLTGAGTATVWACGGFFPEPSVPPVSNAKPFPLESVETRVPKSDDTPGAWTKPVPKEVVAAGTDKPATDGKAAVKRGVAKPGGAVLETPAGDITAVSDRPEKFVEFFRRQTVLIAHIPAATLDKMLYDAKGPSEPVFVDNASFNNDLRTV